MFTTFLLILSVLGETEIPEINKNNEAEAVVATLGIRVLDPASCLASNPYSSSTPYGSIVAYESDDTKPTWTGGSKYVPFDSTSTIKKSLVQMYNEMLINYDCLVSVQWTLDIDGTELKTSVNLSDVASSKNRNLKPVEVFTISGLADGKYLSLGYKRNSAEQIRSIQRSNQERRSGLKSPYIEIHVKDSTYRRFTLPLSNGWFTHANTIDLEIKQRDYELHRPHEHIPSKLVMELKAQKMEMNRSNVALVPGMRQVSRASDGALKEIVTDAAPAPKGFLESYWIHILGGLVLLNFVA